MDELHMALVNSHAGHLESAPVSHERSLVERARAMESGAWDELYSLHHAAIHRYVRFRVSDISAAEDLAADVFLEAVRGIGRYGYRGVAFRAWLYRIAHNLTVDFRRRQAARQLHENNDDVAASQVPDADFAPGVDRARDIRTALAQLTDEQQQVVILRFFEGLSLEETAVATGRKPGAIKSLQHRAIERLRIIMEGGE